VFDSHVARRMSNPEWVDNWVVCTVGHCTDPIDWTGPGCRRLSWDQRTDLRSRCGQKTRQPTEVEKAVFTLGGEDAVIELLAAQERERTTSNEKEHLNEYDEDRERDRDRVE